MRESKTFGLPRDELDVPSEHYFCSKLTAQPGGCGTVVGIVSQSGAGGPSRA